MSKFISKIENDVQDKDSAAWNLLCEYVDEVAFNMDCCEAILSGYLSEARESLTAADFDHIYEAVLLITFELGLYL